MEGLMDIVRIKEEHISSESQSNSEPENYSSIQVRIEIKQEIEDTVFPENQVPTKKTRSSSGAKANSIKHKTSKKRQNISQGQSQPTKIVKTRREFECPTCFKKFNNQSNFNRHKRTPSNSLKLYKCDSCSLTFALKNYLTQHSLLHSKKKYECDLCPYSSFRKDDLEKHAVRKHVVDKEFHCDNCPQRFIDHKNLKNHVKRTHTHPRFKCGICLQVFSRSDHLTEHKLIHEAERTQFPCDICSKFFLTRTSFRSHMRKAHMIKILPIFRSLILMEKVPK